MEEITIDFGPIPRLGTKIIDKTDEYGILIDPGGIKKNNDRASIWDVSVFRVSS